MKKLGVAPSVPADSVAVTPSVTPHHAPDGRELIAPRPPVTSPSAVSQQVARRVAMLANPTATRVSAALNSLQEWTSQHQAEASHHIETIRLAEDLFQSVASQTKIDTTPDEDKRTQVTRTAAACFLLERICAIFQRYHMVLGPVSEVILRSVYVPDTPEMRTLLGTVEHPIDVDEKYRELLAPYARKTYSIAQSEVSKLVAQHAKENRTIEIKLSRQSKTFDLMAKHWMKSVVRNYFLGWRQHCRRRTDMRMKHYYHFQRMRIDASKRRAICMWRDRAAYVKRTAMIDAITQQELATVLSSTETLQARIAELTTEQGQMAKKITQCEEQRLELQAIVEEKEAAYSRLQSTISEMDKVGSELLDSVLMSEDPPSGANPLEVLVAWGHGLITQAGGLGDAPLQPLLTEDFTVDVPWVAFACIMTRIHAEREPRKVEIETVLNNVTEAPMLLVAMYERVTGAKSLVNVDQLRSKQRGLLLLFLAGLMRFASNWLVCRPPSKKKIREAAVALGNGDMESFADGNAAGAGAGDNDAIGGMGEWSTTEKPFTQATVEKNFLGFNAHQTWAAKVRHQQQWVTASMSALHTALEISTHRPPILTSDEQEDLIMFMNVPMIRIVHILPKANPNGFFLTLMKSMQQVFSDLRKVYFAYAIPALTYPDIVRLAKDCKLLDHKKMSKTDVLSICLDTWAGDRNPAAQTAQSTANARNKSVRRTGSNPDMSILRLPVEEAAVDIATRVLEPRHFTELMLRMALFYNKRISKEPREEISIPIATGFVTESVAPHALRSDVDRFRQIVRHPQVRLQLAKYRPQLLRVFKRFAQQDEGHSMSRQNFFDMAQECRWQSKTVTVDILTDIYKRCQVPDAATMLEALDFYECFEAIVAVTLFSDPNPLVPAYQKLPPFVEDRILLPLQM